MDNFEEIITPLLGVSYRISNINVLTYFKPRKKQVYNKKSKVVITPMGKFNSLSEAALAHGLSTSTICARLKKGHEGYEYVKLSTTS